MKPEMIQDQTSSDPDPPARLSLYQVNSTNGPFHAVSQPQFT